MTLEERVTELEVRLAYQDSVIAALDEVVREFAARVEKLERKGRPDEHAPPIGPPDDPPPHY